MKNFLFFILLFLGMAGVSLAGNVTSLDGVVAVVNNKVITQSEFNKALAKASAQLHAQNTALPTQEQLQKQVLDQLIHKTVQLQLAEQAGIKATPAQIDKAIASIAKNNGLTVQQLYTEVGRTGVSIKEYREDIHDEYIIQQIQQQAIGPRISVSDQEVEDFMRSAAWLASMNKEYHLEDILIALPDNPSSQEMANARKKAENIIAKLHTGAKFKDVAAAESSDDNALQGGDLGWRKLPEVPTIFAALILPAKPHEILGPVQAANGFHILHLVDIRQTSQKQKVENPKQRVRKLLFERKYDEALQNWLTKIRSDAFIKTTL